MRMMTPMVGNRSDYCLIAVDRGVRARNFAANDCVRLPGSTS
jgi:hypothetical protein